MIALLSRAAKALPALLGERWWLLLLLVLAASALYVDARHARADRDSLAAWARELCAIAGADLGAVDDARRAECRQAVQALARFRADAQAQAAATLARAAADREEKAGRDRTTAARQAGARAAATRQMEDQDARIDGDTVDGNWFAALNRLGGLRD